MVKTMCSFSAPSPSSPFHLPAKSLSVFAACPIAHWGTEARSATPNKNARRPGILGREDRPAKSKLALSLIFLCKIDLLFSSAAFYFSLIELVTTSVRGGVTEWARNGAFGDRGLQDHRRVSAKATWGQSN